MDCITILAQTVETTGQQVESAEGAIVPIEEIWAHITSLSLPEALTFISFGTVCLFYGWRVFKILVVISSALFGLLMGIVISDKIGGGSNPLLGVLLSIVMAIVSVPLMRWAVGILGAVAGGIVTAGLWYACRLPEQYIWAGGLTGVVAGGMISFIIFKIAVMLFSSLGGSALVVTGTLALLHLYPQTSPQIQQLFFDTKWFLPTVLIVPTAMGVYLQSKFVKGSADWSV